MRVRTCVYSVCICLRLYECVWVCVCACECVRVHAEAIINLMTKFMCKYPYGRTQARIVVVLGRRQNFFRRPFSHKFVKQWKTKKKVPTSLTTFAGPKPS